MKATAIQTAMTLVALAGGSVINEDLHVNLADAHQTKLLQTDEGSTYIHLCSDGSYAVATVTKDAETMNFHGHVKHMAPGLIQESADSCYITSTLVAFSHGLFLTEDL